MGTNSLSLSAVRFSILHLATITSLHLSSADLFESHYRDIMMLRKYNVKFTKADKPQTFNKDFKNYERMNNLPPAVSRMISSSLSMKKHYLHALSLNKKKADLTEIFVTLGTKFMAFVAGVNYNNCYVLKNSLPDELRRKCKNNANVLIAFSIVGTKEVLESLTVFLINSNVHFTIQKYLKSVFNNALKRMRDFESFTEFYERNSNLYDDAHVGSHSKNSTSIELHYNKLRQMEEDHIGEIMRTVAFIFECVKIGAKYENLRIQNPELILPYDKASKMWKKNSPITTSQASDLDVLSIIQSAAIARIETMYDITSEENKKLMEVKSKRFRIHFTGKNQIETMFRNELDSHPISCLK